MHEVVLALLNGRLKRSFVRAALKQLLDLVVGRRPHSLVEESGRDLKYAAGDTRVCGNRSSLIAITTAVAEEVEEIGLNRGEVLTFIRKRNLCHRLSPLNPAPKFGDAQAAGRVIAEPTSIYTE